MLLLQLLTKLKKTGRAEYLVKIEGDITENATAIVDPTIDRSRVSFVQGDACSLPSSLNRFHLLLGANLVCRLPSPKSFLTSLPSIIHTGGYVVLFSPHTWLETYTSKDEWLGGYYDKEGKEVRTYDQLKKIMESDGKFKLIGTKNVPFYIRETYRKNQWTISNMTVFQRL